MPRATSTVVVGLLLLSPAAALAQVPAAVPPDAKAPTAAAPLTPIVPSPENPRRPAYPGWQRASNYGLLAFSASAATLLMIDEGPLHALNDAAVVAESALAGVAVSSMMTIALGRPRPFLYGEKAPLSARNSVDGGLSFLSSHAAVSFAIATSSAMTIRRRHPQSSAAWWVLAGGGAMASFVATARVLGGMHFITDSIGGAIVGASLGVLIPALHRSPVTVMPVVSFADGGSGWRGLALGTRF